MNSTIFPPVPEDTELAARAVYGGGNTYLSIGDQAEGLFSGLCMKRSSSALMNTQHKTAVFHLVTVFQHMESLPDRLAVDAMKERVDWIYALHLPMNSLRLESSQLCVFRVLISMDLEFMGDFQKLLDRMAILPQITLSPDIFGDANEVISHVCRISRLEMIWEAVRRVLETLAVNRPEWLREHSLPYWYERYSHARRTLDLKTGKREQDEFAKEVGNDGFYILKELPISNQESLLYLSEIVNLRKILADHFEQDTDGIVWRKGACAGCRLSN